MFFYSKKKRQEKLYKNRLSRNNKKIKSYRHKCSWKESLIQQIKCYSLQKFLQLAMIKECKFLLKLEKISQKKELAMKVMKNANYVSNNVAISF